MKNALNYKNFNFKKNTPNSRNDDKIRWSNQFCLDRIFEKGFDLKQLGQDNSILLKNEGR